MAKTALDLTDEERRMYRPLDLVGRGENDQEIEARRAVAWDTAMKAAALLRGDFGARKVVVFGSLVHAERFGRWSDIDLAAWGISPGLFYSAVGAVTGLSASFKVDLVDIADCRPILKTVIEQEGIEI